MGERHCSIQSSCEVVTIVAVEVQEKYWRGPLFRVGRAGNSAVKGVQLIETGRLLYRRMQSPIVLKEAGIEQQQEKTTEHELKQG